MHHVQIPHLHHIFLTIINICVFINHLQKGKYYILFNIALQEYINIMVETNDKAILHFKAMCIQHVQHYISSENVKVFLVSLLLLHEWLMSLG